MVFRIAICPNAFRGSLTAFEAAKIIADGLHQSQFHCSTLLLPLADGGDGTLDVWRTVTDADLITCQAHDPLHRLITAQYGRKDDVALIEMARASGIELLAPTEHDPLQTSTIGTGELIAHAASQGAQHILVGVGGSATVDGGTGALHALGVRFYNDAGVQLVPQGGNLHEIASIDVEIAIKRLADVRMTVLCDVENPLLGVNGAAPVFAPQKGATADTVQQLEDNLAHLANMLHAATGTRVHDMPRGGAAGGLAAGLVAVFGAEASSGAKYLIQAGNYAETLKDEAIDLVITGEGKLDTQTIAGKAVQLIARTAAALEIPTVAFAGTMALAAHAFAQLPVQAAYSIVQRPCTLEDALANASDWLRLSAINLGNLLSLEVKQK